MKVSIRKIISSVLLVSVLFCATSCGNGINIDDEVTVDNANKDYKTITHAYLQSIFTGDEELFYKCYPEEIAEYMDPTDFFKAANDSLDEGFSYYGVSFKASNDYVKEDDYDEDAMRTNISLIHDVDESRILQMVLVKDQVFYKNGKHYQSSDVYVMVYELALVSPIEGAATIDYDTEVVETYSTDVALTGETAWYVFELANSDSQFYNN